MRGLFESLATAFLLIAVVMMIVLRSPTAGLISMVPNLLPVIVIFGMMGWTNILVDVGSMMTASVALGVAVDDTIHYLTWYRRGLDRGLDRKPAVMMAYERCATAMTQTTLIAGFGLAVFAFSTFTPTQRFGMLMLTLLFAALFGDLIFLPAMLSGPFGKLFRLKKTKPSEEEATGEIVEDDAMVAIPVHDEHGRRVLIPHTAHRKAHRAS
jgi:predicted RND superfamily exporter protein